MIEKPFGHDLESARELNAELHEVLDESQIFRIDHFLGKEPVRTSSTCASPTRSSSRSGTASYVDSVQITLAEDFGVEDRGSFYDPVGALRDVVQNHLLQVLALVAMEPPSAAADPTPSATEDDVFRAMPRRRPGPLRARPVRRLSRRRGGRRGLETETFVALRLEVDNWRWAGVPFFIRAGKAHAGRGDRGRVVFKRAAAARDRRRGRCPTRRARPPDRARAGSRAVPAGEEGRRGGAATASTSTCCSRAGRATSPSPTSGCSATR